VIGRLAGSLGLVPAPSVLSAGDLVGQLSLDAFEGALRLNKDFGITGTLGSQTDLNS
jgi:hypothetical protein